MQAITVPSVFRDMLNIGTVWEDRMKKMTNTQDGSEYVGGWRNGEKNGWGQLTSNRYVKYFLFNCKNENETFCLILIRVASRTSSLSA